MPYCEYCGQKIKKNQLTKTLQSGKIIHRDCIPKTQPKSLDEW